MKKRLLIVGIGFALALSACGSKDVETVNDSTKEQQVEVSQKKGEESQEEKDEKAEEEITTAITPSEGIMSENFNAITGEHLLYEDDGVKISMVDGGIQYNTYEDGTHDYTMQVKYEAKDGEPFDDKRNGTIYGFEFNGYIVRAFTNTEGFDYDLRNVTEENCVCTVELNTDDMFAFQKSVADPEIKSMKALVSRSKGGKKQPLTIWYTTGEEVRTDGCPDQFGLKEEMKLVVSDGLEDIYYGGYYYVDDEKTVHYILMRDIHDFSDEYVMEPNLYGYIKVNGGDISQSFSIDENYVYYPANTKVLVSMAFKTEYLKKNTKEDQFVIYLDGKDSLIHDSTKPVSYEVVGINSDIVDVSDEFRMFIK